jgi:hypothetical protein
MTNKTIFNLGSISVPLAGTEVIPIWNGTTTTKVTVANLTVGRVVTSSGQVIDASTTPTLKFVNGTTSSFSRLDFYTGATYEGSITHQASSGVLEITAGRAAAWGGRVSFVVDTVNQVEILNTGDIKMLRGNLVQGTASKGINFTANTPAAGMTSQLLNWYEEGAWTPTLTSGSGTITTVGTCAGKYTRMGRCIVYTMNCTITTNGTGGNYIIVGGFSSVASLPTDASLQGFDTSTTKTVGGRYAGANTILMRFYDGTYPGSDGANFLATVVVNL